MKLKDWDDASTLQETPKIGSLPPEMDESWNRSSLTASEGTLLANTLVLEFWSPEL